MNVVADAIERALYRCGAGFVLGLLTLVPAQGAQITVQPAGNQGFDVYANGVLVAPIRLAANGVIVADSVVTNASGVLLSGLRATDPLAVTFATNDYVSLTLPAPGDTNADPVVQFHLTLGNFNTNRWLALFPDGLAPFHFLVCPMPTAQVWHQRGWLNATPNADPFPLLQDVIARISEVLPAPFAPTMATTSRSPTSSETPSSAWASP